MITEGFNNFYFEYLLMICTNIIFISQLAHKFEQTYAMY